jgi:hypothetical protein
MQDHVDMDLSLDLTAAEEENVSDQEMWRSKVHARWQGASAMPPVRQKELIEEYVAELPPLPHGCPRRTQPELIARLHQSEQRNQRVRLAPSAKLPALTGVYICEAPAPPNVKYRPRERVLDYTGWLLTTAEYLRFGYAVHTGVGLGRLFDDDATHYVLLGDPTMPAAQINCVRGSSVKQPNVKLVLNRSALKTVHWPARSAVGVAAAAVPTAASSASAAAPIDIILEGEDDEDDDGDKQHYATDALVTVRAAKTLQPGEELWLDYGATYWEEIALYCPHCLEFGADADDRMVLCDHGVVAPGAGGGCRRAWHQLCMHPCLVEVPEGACVCDLHQQIH